MDNADMEPTETHDELRHEYDLTSLRVHRAGAERKNLPRTMVALDADVAQVFTTPEAVNHALRALIAVMPVGKTR
jgi:hypothetical protein